MQKRVKTLNKQGAIAIINASYCYGCLLAGSFGQFRSDFDW
jgi:hypothetical protein